MRHEDGPTGLAARLPARADAPPAAAILRGRRLGLSYESSANLFYRDLAEGLRAAATAQGASVVARECGPPPEGRTAVDGQVADIAALLAEGVDALVLSPLASAGMETAVAAAHARGVPVFTVDREATGCPVVSHVTSDNLLGGRLAAGLLATLLEGPGEVAIVGLPGATSIADRVAGFTAALAGQDRLRVVGEVNGASNRRRAREVTAALLQAHPRLRGIFAVNDVTVQGVLNAVREAGREATMIVVGYDATPHACEEIMRGGALRGEIAQFPARLGHTVVGLWADYLRGSAVPPRVEIPVELVTSENVERFTGAERLLEIRRGAVQIAGERVVFFPIRGYQMMLNEIHAASPDLLRHIVYRSGFVLGESIAAQVRSLYPDPRDRLFVLLEDLSRGGFGTFELLSLDVAAGQAEVRGHNLFEAAIAPGLAWVRTPRCVDIYCSGRLAGYATAILGRPAACEELSCQARGDPYCQFVLTSDGPRGSATAPDPLPASARADHR